MKRCAKEKEGDRISKVRKLWSDIRSFFEQPTNASGECTCTGVLTHASIQPTDAAQLDSIPTLQVVLSKPPNVLLDQMTINVVGMPFICAGTSHIRCGRPLKLYIRILYEFPLHN